MILSAIFILYSPCNLNWTCPKSQVKLDASFAEAFLVATAEDTSTVLPLNSDAPDLEVKNNIHGTVQLTKLDRSGVVQIGFWSFPVNMYSMSLEVLLKDVIFFLC